MNGSAANREDPVAIEARQFRRHASRGRGAQGDERAATDLVQLVAFVAAGVECAVRVERVREIIEVGFLRPHPAATGDLRGVIALQSGPAVVLDLGSRLGSGETEITRLSCALALERPFHSELPFALLVEYVRDLVAVPKLDLAPTPRLGGIPGTFGEVARLPGRLLPVVDLDRLLTTADEACAAAIAHENPAPQVPGQRPINP